ELHPEVQQRERTDTDRLRAGGERDHVRSGGARTGSSSTGSAIILYGLFHHSAKTRCQHCYSFGGDLDEAIGCGDHASRCSLDAYDPRVRCHSMSAFRSKRPGANSADKVPTSESTRTCAIFHSSTFSACRPIRTSAVSRILIESRLTTTRGLPAPERYR